MQAQDLLVVGAGLIGTSIGLAATAAGWTVRLVDEDADRARFAASLGAGANVGAEAAHPPPALVVVAVPPRLVGVSCHAALTTYPQAVVTHVCSVQSKPAQEVETLGGDTSRFVGGHPIAGREVSGPASADAALFTDRPWVVCALPRTSPLAADAVRALARACGARPVDLAPADHDRLLARLSHAPQLVASALASTVADLEPGAAALAGSGLRDTTRLADSDPAMWAQIAAANPAALAQAVRAVADPLVLLAERLEADDPDIAGRAVGELMQRGRAGRALLPGKHGGPAVALATVHCVVPDSPGALARLFADIAAVGVNVEDVRMEHAPGQPAGSIELAVAPANQMPLVRTLRDRGWSVTEGVGENV